MPDVITDTSPIQYLYQTNLLDLLPLKHGLLDDYLSHPLKNPSLKMAFA
jgi:hypothetical protein